MFWLVPMAIAGVTALLIALTADDEETEKKEKTMANCNKLFLDFEKNVSLIASEKAKLRNSRNSLQEKVKKDLNGRSNISFMGFYIQGSQSPRFLTGIIKKDGTYDVDLGIYLKKKPDVSSTTVQKYVYDAVKNHTDAGAKHLAKCIRVVYAGDFDIDLVIYYQEEGDTVPYIALKDGTWRKDDPKGISEWFKEKKKGTNGQLVRVIKYLKVWADERGFKMPSGFALTIWAAENFCKDETRDDKALLATLKAIKNALGGNVMCLCPKHPYDDLTVNLDENQKEKFTNALDAFIQDAEKAVNSDNQLSASKLWQKHLGTRFPDGIDEDVDKKEEELKAMTSLIQQKVAKMDSSGRIQATVGIPHVGHRNHGG